MSDGLVLSCKPGREGNALVFTYRLQNHGAQPLLVLDGLTEVNPAGREGRGQPVANLGYAVVFQTASGDALTGKILPPPPEGAVVVQGAVPLAARLAPGGVVERVLRVPLPLAETNPFFADLPLRGYTPVSITGVRFAVGYWPEPAAGVASAPADFAPGLMMVGGRPEAVAAAALLVSQHFPVSKLELFRRTDAFPRPELSG